MYTIQVVTPASSEPVAVSDLKTHRRLNTTAEDSLLAGFITTARQVFEMYTNLVLMLTTLRQWCRVWPTQNSTPYLATGHIWDSPPVIPPVAIYLMRGPVQSITNVKYYDTTDTQQTLSGTQTDVISTPASVRLPSGSYPALSTNISPPISVDFVAGYSSASAVPQAIKTGITLLASHYYQNRSEVTEKRLDRLPMGFQALVSPYKSGVVGQWGN